MPLLLIDDGCTEDGIVPATPRTPEVRFRYRPALPEAVYGFLGAPRGSGKQSLAAVVAILSAHLVSWDVADASGATVPVTPEALAKVPHRVLGKLADAVMGYDADKQEADAGN